MSEIAPAPRALLKQQFPEVLLHGDFTTIQNEPIYRGIDVLVGGTPCQDFSASGLRAGIAGDRGNLTLEFIKLADRLKPAYIVWENVPGVLSLDDGKTFEMILNELTRIGYACDCDILDAQYFGLAQRRERVFVVCVRLDDLLPRKTPLSSRVAAELILQPLLETWAAILQAWCPDQPRLASIYPTEPRASSVMKKTTLLKQALGRSAFTKLLSALAGNPALATEEHHSSVLISRERREPPSRELSKGIDGFPSLLTDEESGAQSTDLSWNSILVALFQAENESIMSTSISSTIESEICTFAERSLNTLRYIMDCESFLDPPKWPSDFWQLALLILTLAEAITSYAEQANSNLFIARQLRDDWGDHIDDARGLALLAQRHIGDWDSSKPLFSLPESMCWNPPPSREQRKSIAGTLESRTGAGGAAWGTDWLLDGGMTTGSITGSLGGSASHVSGLENEDTFLVPDVVGNSGTNVLAYGGNNQSGPIEVSTAVNAHPSASGRQDFESETFIVGGVRNDITHALRGEGFDASEDGSGRGTPIIAFQDRFRGDDGRGYDRPPPVSEDITGALETVKPWNVAVNFEHGLAPHGSMETSDTVAALTDSEHKGHTAVITSGVRRLTPRECERLQGFSDNFTLVPYRGKPMADGPRYQMLGNSIAVPVLKWIGKRIEKVNNRG